MVCVIVIWLKMHSKLSWALSHGLGAELSIFLGNLDHLGRGRGVSHPANWGSWHGSWRSNNRLQHSPPGLHLISEPRAHSLALTTPSVDILGPARGIFSSFHSLQSFCVYVQLSGKLFNNDFIWFTLSTADRQIGDSPKLLKIQEKYRQQWSPPGETPGHWQSEAVWKLWIWS